MAKAQCRAGAVQTVLHIMKLLSSVNYYHTLCGCSPCRNIPQECAEEPLQPAGGPRLAPGKRPQERLVQTGQVSKWVVVQQDEHAMLHNERMATRGLCTEMGIETIAAGALLRK